MKNLLVLLLVAVSPFSLSDTSEPLTKCQVESYCMNVKHHLNATDELVTNTSKKANDNKLKITELDKQVAVFEVKYQALNDKVEKLDSTIWGSFSFTTELFMWVFVVGMGLTGLFIWRDHSVFKKSWKLKRKKFRMLNVKLKLKERKQNRLLLMPGMKLTPL